MSEEIIQDGLWYLLARFYGFEDTVLNKVAICKTLKDAGISDTDKGVLIQMEDGSEFQLHQADRQIRPGLLRAARHTHPLNHSTTETPNAQGAQRRKGGNPTMAVRKKPKNDFGVELMAFCATYGLTYRDVATGADVKRSTLIECTTGRCAGHELIPKVRQFMADYEAQKASR